jgi:hypothetical protein
MTGTYPQGTQIHDEDGNLVATLAVDIVRGEKILPGYIIMEATGETTVEGEPIHPAIVRYFRMMAPPLR